MAMNTKTRKTAGGKPAAKSTNSKKTAPAAKTAARTTTKAAPARKAPAKGKTAKVAAKATPALPTSISEKRSWRTDAKINPKTGFTKGTTSDLIGMALLKGGESRKDIVANIEGLPSQTRNGTSFQASAVVGQVERQMKALGFRVVQSYKLLPPKK